MTLPRFHQLIVPLAIVGFAFLAGCSKESVSFEFVHVTTLDAPTFVAVTSDTALIRKVRSELTRPLAKRTLHINGPIARGDGGHNAPWSWHFIPDKWELAEISMELCDAQLYYIEQNLDTWLKEVGRYCPWDSQVSREQ